MEISSLLNFNAAQKQTTEKNEGSKDAHLPASAQSQGTTTKEAQTKPLPPVNQTAELSGEEGNRTTSESGKAVDLLA